MRKKLLCALTAAVLLLGVLAGCGGGPADGTNPGLPGAGSTQPGQSGQPDQAGQSGKPDDGGPAEDDPVAVMNARVRAVNDALNYACIGLEETVEAGLLFYGLTNGPLGETAEYDPDKPLDYNVYYKMESWHLKKGIADDDTYSALLKDVWQDRARPTDTFSPDDIIKTDTLYIYPAPYTAQPRYCYILAKDTDVVYRFTISEAWRKADYYEYGDYPVYEGTFISAGAHLQPPASGYEEKPVDLSYTEADAEYIFTDEFWKAFAQTAKFVGKADENYKGVHIERNFGSFGRSKGIKVPYVEAWYAGGTMSLTAIRDGFESFVKNFLENREIEVVFYLDDGTEKRCPATKDEFGYEITINLGNGQEWIYGDKGDGFLYLMKEPDHVTGEYLPEEGRLIYKNDIPSLLVIDDFGQGEPTLFFNNALYRYAGAGEVVLIHDFSKDVDESWRAMTIDAGRTRLMFSGWPHYERLTVIDLKTFAVMDDISITYGADDTGIFELYEAKVNGVAVDEDTAYDAYYKWYSEGDIELTDRMYGEEADFNSAWRAYQDRP